MKKQFGDYRRLARGIFGCSSLWAGGEHLLYVRGTGLLLPVFEDYVRVSYKDLRAVALVRTYTSLWWNITFGAGCLLFALPAIYLAVTLGAGSYFDQEKAFAIVALALIAVPGLASVVGLAWNLALGKSCVLNLQTDGRAIRVRAARRVRTAIRVRDGIRDIMAQKAPAPPPPQPEIA